MPIGEDFAREQQRRSTRRFEADSLGVARRIFFSTDWWWASWVIHGDEKKQRTKNPWGSVGASAGSAKLWRRVELQTPWESGTVAQKSKALWRSW